MQNEMHKSVTNQTTELGVVFLNKSVILSCKAPRVDLTLLFLALAAATCFGRHVMPLFTRLSSREDIPNPIFASTVKTPHYFCIFV